jgi:hypothetical protein
VLSGRQVVERVHDDRELLDVVQAELLGLDVGMVCLALDIRVEHLNGLLGDERLRLVNVMRAEQELAVQVGNVNGVQVDNLFKET